MTRSIRVEHFHPSKNLSFDIKFYENLIYERINDKNIFKTHEEYELTAIFSRSGKRIVGNSIHNYSEGDLFLLGPNLPHLIIPDEPEKSTAICIHFKEDSFGSDFFHKPENKNILKLLKKSSLGCSFSGSEASIVKEKLKQLISLGSFEKMIGLLKILNELGKSSNCKVLSSPGYRPNIKTKEIQRTSMIYDYIIENFTRNLKIEDLSKEFHVSPSTFSRHFKKAMNKPFSVFITEVRIGHACKLLLNSDLNISEICFKSGYQEITHFNRQFKKQMGVTPSTYRKKQFNSN